ncbi:MAG TPA: trypsin-like peptidase domain-containing protein [Blastocatellia bacterium]|nr:trypsin-like peptidase domain-containing protein [Blastocatellia bacterium]
MSRLMFVYLSGTEKGKTRIFTQDHVTIGTSDASDLKLVPEEGGALPGGVLADVYNDDSTFHLVPQGEQERLEITINGEPLGPNGSPAGHVLRDGDTIHFGHGLSSASVLFQVMPENFSANNLARRNKDIEQVSGQSVHPLTATLFVKELTASLWAEIPRRAKWTAVAALVVVSIAVLGIAMFGLLTLIRITNKTEILGDQISAVQARRDQDQELIKKQQDEIERLRDVSEQTRRFTQKIAELYSPGVCLIVGSYSFVERGTGRPLRYDSADAANDLPVDKNGNLLVSVDGAGPPWQVDYTGTGFVVEEGVITTNKHVVQPWVNDRVAQIIQEQGGGFVPRLDTLVAFFPSIKTPFELKVASTSPRYDIALCKFEQRDAALPVLPLSAEDPRSIIGEPVVLLGYPTGVDGLLQRIEESERREILRAHGLSAADVAQGLAGRGLIRPLTTTGTISDALPGKIVHTAQTTEGGSGSPMFDRDLRVIAINSAILTTIDGTQSFGGSNFGVPIKVAYEMLQTYDKANPKPASGP